MHSDNNELGVLLFSTKRAEDKFEVIKRTISFFVGLIFTLILNFLIISLFLDAQVFIQFIAEISVDYMFHFGGVDTPRIPEISFGNKILVLAIALIFLVVIAGIKYINFFRCKIDAYENCLIGATISDKIFAYLVGKQINNFCLIKFEIPYSQITGVSYFGKTGLNIHVHGNIYPCFVGREESRGRIYSIIMEKKTVVCGTPVGTLAPVYAPAPESSKVAKAIAIIILALCLIIFMTMFI